MTTEVEMEAKILAVLGELPMPWRSVVNGTKLDPATVSRILSRLQGRHQVVLQRDGYVLVTQEAMMPPPVVATKTAFVADFSDRESPLAPQKPPQNAVESPLGVKSPAPRTASSPTLPRKRGPYKTRKGKPWEKPAGPEALVSIDVRPVATVKSQVDGVFGKVIAYLEGERDRLTVAIEELRKL